MCCPAAPFASDGSGGSAGDSAGHSAVAAIPSRGSWAAGTRMTPAPPQQRRPQTTIDEGAEG